MRDVPEPPAHTRSDVSLRLGARGARFTFTHPLIRSTMLLDFFATFFSSATALLPIFARTSSRSGRRATAGCTPRRRWGRCWRAWRWCASRSGSCTAGACSCGRSAIYGLATIVFGLSRSFALTFLCLAVTGVADTVSMVLRNVVRQLATPDTMRGRMTGVNMMFFMGGPQLGELEAGLVAQATTAPWSVITGGIGCVIATAWTAWRTPELRDYVKPAPGAAEAEA